ncbi:MAG TPA: glycosyl transferase family 1, partial [Chloroflexota bacterium]|nr:glycosyl transferase family 1 [Chloroflexota bacterium]
MPALSPANAVFVSVSFEGPDEYARAGGLGVRVRDLTQTLAEAGFRTHLFFLGDPSLPSVERNGGLVLHRWAQWLSANYPAGVYDGEWEKRRDLAESLPPFLVEQIIAPAAAQGKVTVVMTEDWQTAPAAIRLYDLLLRHGLADRVIPAWTANNVYGFETIDWQRLGRAAAIMTISRY